jgi:membrane-bound metal-dependent hydrolase YbcI (DUF457 family)
MRGGAHLYLAATSGIFLASLTGRVGEAGPLLVGAAVGGLLPDIDLPPHTASPLERWIMRAARRTRVSTLGWAVTVAIRLLRVVLAMLGTRHRGWLHSPLVPLGLAVSGLAAGGVAGWMLLGTAVGVFSHLVGDSLTPSGVSWFGKRVRGPFRTDGGADVVGFVVGSLLLLLAIAFEGGR